MKKALLIILIFSTITNIFGQIPIIQTPQPATLGSFGNQNFFPNTNTNVFQQNQQHINQFHTEQQRHIQQQNQMLINQATQYQQRGTLPKDVLDDIAELESRRYANPEEAYKTLKYQFPTVTAKGADFYETALTKFENMLSGKEPLNLKRAVYLVENAYYENTMPYKDFDETLKNIGYLISLKMKEQKMPNTDLGFINK